MNELAHSFTAAIGVIQRDAPSDMRDNSQEVDEFKKTVLLTTTLLHLNIYQISTLALDIANSTKALDKMIESIDYCALTDE